MKKLLLFLPILLLMLACADDDEGGGDDCRNADLNYDCANFSAPALPTGIYETAVRFTPDLTQEFAGQNLTEVEIYFASVSAATVLKIYGPGTANTPGDLLYSRIISADMRTDSWNSHVLTDPVAITGDDLWVSVLVDHPDNIRTVGCDPGPALSNADFIFSESENRWTTLRDFTAGEADINWNIRAYVD